MVYKFKVSLSSDKNIHREIKILGSQNFKDLHHTMMKAFQLSRISAASFYKCDTKWKKGQRISLTRQPDDITTAAMDLSTIEEYATDDAQRFIYECKTMSPWSFNLELTKKSKPTDPPNRYPKWDDTSGLTILNKRTILTPIITSVDDDEEDDFAEEDDTFGKGFDELSIADEESDF